MKGGDLLCQPLQSFHGLIKNPRSQGDESRTERRALGEEQKVEAEQKQSKGHVCLPLSASTKGIIVAGSKAAWQRQVIWDLPSPNQTGVMAFVRYIDRVFALSTSKWGHGDRVGSFIFLCNHKRWKRI